jgi:hypothetical protein
VKLVAAAITPAGEGLPERHRAVGEVDPDRPFLGDPAGVCGSAVRRSGEPGADGEQDEE